MRAVTMVGDGPHRYVYALAGAQNGLGVLFAADEGFDVGVRLFVVDLHWWGLHEVGGCRQQRAADAAVQADLGGADRVDDDAGGVRGVPHFELVFERDRGVAKVAAF